MRASDGSEFTAWDRLVRVGLVASVFVGTAVLLVSREAWLPGVVGHAHAQPPQAQPRAEAAAPEPVVMLPLAVHADPALDDALLNAWVDTANGFYAPAGVQFRMIERRPLDAEHRTLRNNRARHNLARRLRDRAINVFFVDEIHDPWPSAATARASARVGRTPSGRLGGAHIPKPNRTPGSYVIVLGTRERSQFAPVGLAHELGHVLGSPHHPDPANIMSYGRDRTGFDEEQLRRFRIRARRLIRRRQVRRVAP